MQDFRQAVEKAIARDANGTVGVGTLLLLIDHLMYLDRRISELEPHAFGVSHTGGD